MSTALRILQGRFGRVALLDMDKRLVTHAHHHCHVLLKAGGADTHFHVRDRACPLNDESAVLVNAWERHSYDHWPGAPRTIILALYIEPAWLADIDRWLFASAHPGFFPQPCVAVTGEVRSAANRLIDVMVHERDLDQAAVEATIFSLMLAVIDRFSEWRALRVPQVGNPAVGDHRIRRAVSCMKAEDEHPHRANDLAKAAGLSRPHFFRRFKETTGLTPGMYQNVIRMETAIAGLTRGEDSIADIAAMLGFTAQGNFTRFFRHHLGIAPSEYRRTVDLFANVRDRRRFDVGADRTSGA